MRAPRFHCFSPYMNNRHLWQLKKIRILGTILELPAKHGPNVLNWHCCLAGSSKTAPRILIFSIAIGADYSFEVKSSEIWAPTFFKHNNSFIATVSPWTEWRTNQNIEATVAYLLKSLFIWTFRLFILIFQPGPTCMKRTAKNIQNSTHPNTFM